MTVGGLLAQQPCFLPSPGAGLHRDLNITDTNCTTRCCITAGKSLPRCKLDHSHMLFQMTESQNSPGWKKPWKIDHLVQPFTGKGALMWFSSICSAAYLKPLVMTLPHPWAGCRTRHFGWNNKKLEKWNNSKWMCECCSGTRCGRSSVAACKQAERPARFPLPTAWQWAKHCCTAAGRHLQPAPAVLRPLQKWVVRPPGDDLPQPALGGVSSTKRKGCKKILIPQGSKYQEINWI